MDESVEEFSTPIVDADGDGLKKTGIRVRIPYPSSKKVKPRTVKDDALVQKLEDALDGLKAVASKRPKKHDCLKKSQTMAEITPSKSKIKKSHPKITSTPLAFLKGDVDEMPLHATPRRMLEASPSSRRCSRDKTSCDVYRRLMLLSWRRSRALLLASRDQCVSQKEQIHQMQLQIDVLKSLRNSEFDKRKEAVAECKQIKKAFEILELENCQLVEELKSANDALDNTTKNWNLAKCDLKRCSLQLLKIQSLLKRTREEKMDLVNKLTDQEREIYAHSGIIARLEENLKSFKINLQNNESTLKIKQCQLDESLENLQAEIDLNSSLTEKISELQIEKCNLEDRSRVLEEQLHDATAYVSLRDNHIINYEDTQASRSWIREPKQLAAKSLTILHKVADILLPIYLDKMF